jgi:NAD+ synthase (glutamine-hydrolysing)
MFVFTASKSSFMRIALAQLDFTIGDFEHNLYKIRGAIAEARAKGADMVVFSELAICGYPPRDFLDYGDFVRRCTSAVESLLPESYDIAIALGTVLPNPVPEGKDLFNALSVLYEGKIAFNYHKTLLPTYDIFDEYRYFEPGKTFDVFHFKGKRIAFTVCEDIWNIANENPLYTICPMDEMMAHQPDFAINLSASPFAWDHAEKRKRIVRENAIRYALPFFYVNQTGAQTEIIFDGGSMVVAADGSLLDELPYFEEHVKVYELDDNSNAITSEKSRVQNADKTSLIYKALICGLKDYFTKLGFKKAILGLSGGIDSAVCAVLAADALGPENVTGLLMPGPYSSDHSVKDAQQLADNLGIKAITMPIDSVYNTYIDALHPHMEGRSFDLTEENLQARIRGMYLMAMSNKFGYVLLNTSNKSEAAVGYGTLYGDMCGGISVIGDLFKMELYALARYINRFEERIPNNSIEKPPSAELRPNQKDSDSLPDYPVLDAILKGYIMDFKGPEELIRDGFDTELVKRVLRLVNQNEFKRFQTAPVLRVSSKAFGMGRRMPIVAKYLF